MERLRNWAGNYTYGASALHVPESVEQLRELVVRFRRIKALGTRHSFNDIADCDGVLISLEKLNRVVALDRKNHRVTVEGGIRCGELSQYLNNNGYALHNLASLPHITVAGACATATHGSGDRNRNLAAAVHSMEVLKADGETVVFTRGQPDRDIAGAAVSLGGLGIIVNMTLDVVPAFPMCQHVYEHLPMAKLQDHFDDIFSSAYSVSLFTDWKQETFNQVWLKRRLDGQASVPVRERDSHPHSEPRPAPGLDPHPSSDHSPVPAADQARDQASDVASRQTADQAADAAFVRSEPEFFGAVLADGKRNPVPGQSPVHCSEQMGIPGPWHERLPHFRMDFTPSAGEELQSEYFVPREKAVEALYAVSRIRDRIWPHLYISEIRTIAADDLWMSPCYRRDSVGIHFTWKADGEAVRQVLPLIEEQLAPYEARPHWGKLFAMPPDQVKACYEKLPDFRELLMRCDPEGKFRNDFLKRYVAD